MLDDPRKLGALVKDDGDVEVLLVGVTAEEPSEDGGEVVLPSGEALGAATEEPSEDGDEVVLSAVDTGEMLPSTSDPSFAVSVEASDPSSVAFVLVIVSLLKELTIT